MRDTGADTVEAILADLATEARRRGRYLRARSGWPPTRDAGDVKPAATEAERERCGKRADAYFEAAKRVETIRAYGGLI
jgi:hypothetical protein